MRKKLVGVCLGLSVFWLTVAPLAGAQAQREVAFWTFHFNLTDQEALRRGSFSLEDIGILPDVPLIVEDARSRVKDSLFEFSRRMPPHSVAVIELWSAKRER